EPGHDEVPEDVAEGEPQDDAVTPEEPVGEPAAHERREVAGHDEQVEVRLRLVLREEQVARHVDGEDGAHPVEREALRALAADDEAHLRGVSLRVGSHAVSAWTSSRSPTYSAGR